MIGSCGPSPHRRGGAPERVERTEREWREVLSEEQFRILRKHGTERAFTGVYWDEKRPGLYRCAGCGTPLFDAATKYESGTGWPSFWAPVDPDHVAEREDRSFFMRRVEVVCAGCDGHLGHVFPDGPDPTGLRYCLNSGALAFEPAAEGAESQADREGAPDSEPGRTSPDHPPRGS